MNKTAQRILVALLILIGLACRVWWFDNTPNLFSVEAESYSKLQLMLQWDQSPLLYPDINFGPLHMPLLKWPWKLTGSLVTANRIVALLFGLALLPLAYLLARRLFGTAVAAGTLAFLALAMIPVKTSVVTLAEGPTAFFMILGLWLITLYVDKHKTGFALLFGAAVAFAAMTALRFETWLFLPILPLWLWKRRGFSQAALFAGLLAIFPLFHLYVCWLKTGDAFHFAHTSAAITAMNSALAPPLQRAVGFFAAMGYSSTWVVVALLPIAIAMLFRLRRGGLIGWMLLVILAMYEYKAVQATLAPELYRYLTAPCILAAIVWPIPIAHGLQLKLGQKSAWPPVILAVIGLALGAWSQVSAFNEQKPIEPTVTVFEMLDQLRPRLSPGDRIFMGSEYHPIVVIESGLVWENFRLPEYPDNANPSTESVEKIFTEYKPTLILVLARDPVFTKVLGFEPACDVSQKAFDVDYCIVGATENWCWYRLCKNDPS